MIQTEQKVTITVDRRWLNLIKLAERTGWGDMSIKLKNGVPTDCETIIPHVRLDQQQDVDDAYRAIGLG